MSVFAIDGGSSRAIAESGQNLVGSSMPSSSSQQAVSFSATLAKINGEMMALQALSGSNSGVGSLSFGNSQNGTGSNSGAGQSELSLLSELISSAQSSVVGISQTSKVPSPSTVNGAEVVGTAAQFIGTPYKWGGTSPAGFDCSGFTQYVYSKLGINIPRTSEQQALVGTRVNGLSHARPGDLVFFAGSDGTPSAPGHVGIYVGNGQMIDAPYTGTDVRIEPVSTAGDVVAIRRVLDSAHATASTKLDAVNIPDKYLSTVVNAANSNGIPPSLLAALLSQESGFNPSAVSPAGAVGIAQFMPATAAGLGVDPYDPSSAIEGAARLIASYVKQFGSYADALAAYNSSSGAVEKYGGIPPYPQTQAYVKNVLSDAGLEGLKGAVK